MEYTFLTAVAVHTEMSTTTRSQNLEGINVKVLVNLNGEQLDLLRNEYGTALCRI